MDLTIPTKTSELFWGDDLNDLSLEKNKKYIVQTILEKGDVEDVKWLFSKVSKEEIKELLSTLRLSDLSSNYWNLFFNRN